MTQPLQTTSDRSAGPIVAAVVAAVAMLFVGLVYLASGVLMPWWAVVLLLITWLVLVWVGIRLARERTYLVLAVPLGAAGLWFFVAWLGDVALGWTA